jgi:DNA-binding response OmpR family regulator
VIDDDRSIRNWLRQILEQAGHEVCEADNGEDGVRLFMDSCSTPARTFDLTITDILMPGKDGMEVILELQELQKNASILAISAGGRGLDADFTLQMAIDFGARKILGKPFSRITLIALVDELLAQRTIPPPEVVIAQSPRV